MSRSPRAAVPREAGAAEDGGGSCPQTTPDLEPDLLGCSVPTGRKQNDASVCVTITKDRGHRVIALCLWLCSQHVIHNNRSMHMARMGPLEYTSVFKHVTRAQWACRTAHRLT